MKAHVFVISMLTGIVVTYAVLLLGCLTYRKLKNQTIPLSTPYAT